MDSRRVAARGRHSWCWASLTVGTCIAYALALASAVRAADPGGVARAAPLAGEPHLIAADAGASESAPVAGDAGAAGSVTAGAGADGGVPSSPAGSGNGCCTARGSAGCDDAEVLACVCEGDEFCCTDSYDQLCITQAQSRCGLDCDARPPASDCCGASDVPGCAVPQVATCVCEVDPFCCAFRFDENCVNLAKTQCAASCPEANAAEAGAAEANVPGAKVGLGGQP